MIKKDGMIRHRDSAVYEAYKKLRAHKDEIMRKARKIQNDLGSGAFCIESEEEDESLHEE